MQMSGQSPASLERFETWNPNLPRTMADGTIIYPALTVPETKLSGGLPPLVGFTPLRSGTDVDLVDGYSTTSEPVDVGVLVIGSVPEPNSLVLLGVGLCLSLLFFGFRHTGGRKLRACRGTSR